MQILSTIMKLGENCLDLVHYVVRFPDPLIVHYYFYCMSVMNCMICVISGVVSITGILCSYPDCSGLSEKAKSGFCVYLELY